MKPIKLFYQARCPFCKKAFNYIDELKKNAPNTRTLSSKPSKRPNNPNWPTNYDYYYVPTFYIATKRYTKAESTQRSRGHLQKSLGTINDDSRTVRL